MKFCNKCVPKKRIKPTRQVSVAGTIKVLPGINFFLIPPFCPPSRKGETENV